jgi:glycosyltransferase involved in cell wall biosynthesis
MSISIIIPAYNGEAFIRSTIESVVAQTIRNWELIIVDDGSQDNTAAMIASCAKDDSRIRTVTQENQGVAAARNRGFMESNPGCEYVAFLDQDDVWEPDALETLSSAMRSEPNAAAAHGLCRLIDSAGKTISAFTPPVRKCFTLSGFRSCQPDEPTIFGVFLNGNMIYTPGQALIRRNALSANPFDPSIVPADDWDLWLRLSAQRPLTFVERAVIGWRQHESNQSKSRLKMAKARRKVYEKLNSSNITDSQRELLLWYLRSASLHRTYRRNLRRSAWYASRCQAGRALRLFFRAALVFFDLRREQRNTATRQRLPFAESSE